MQSSTKQMEYFYFFEGSCAGTPMSQEFHDEIIRTCHTENEILTRYYQLKLSEIHEEYKESYKETGTFKWSVEKFIMWAKGVVYFRTYNIYPNDELHGYVSVDKTKILENGYIKKLIAKRQENTDIERRGLSMNKKPKIYTPTVVNNPIEIDRTSKDFVIKEDINVLTKDELLRLGTMLGLSGLTKLSKDKIKAKCLTRRTNQHFQTYVETILLENKK